MPGLLDSTATPIEPGHGSEPQDSEENTAVSIEISGKSVHPAKLVAMLRSSFGVGTYDLMVWVSEDLEAAAVFRDILTLLLCIRWAAGPIL